MDLESLPAAITPVRVRAQQAQQQGLEPSGLAPAGSGGAAWEAYPTPPREPAGAAVSLHDAGPASAAAAAAVAPSGAPWSEPSPDLVVPLPPKHLFTCTVGKSVLSKARCAGCWQGAERGRASAIRPEQRGTWVATGRALQKMSLRPMLHTFPTPTPAAACRLYPCRAAAAGTA